LHHLVHGAVALVQKALAEPDCAIINDAGFLERKEALVAAVWWDEPAGSNVFISRRTQGTKTIQIRLT